MKETSRAGSEREDSSVRIYLDLCAIQRPLDTANQIRIALEAEAVLGILALLDAGQIELLSSAALAYEAEQNPVPLRREHARAVLAKAREELQLSENIRARAEQLVALGFQALDALHLAFAEAGEADYFCTCDDRLTRRAQQAAVRVKVVSPLDVIREIER